jgi:hypothetical protein
VAHGHHLARRALIYMRQSTLEQLDGGVQLTATQAQASMYAPLWAQPGPLREGNIEYAKDDNRRRHC